MAISILKQTWDPRRALQITRYHTWPRIREQSVGEHSMQVLRILLAIWPDVPRNVMVWCLKHDMGECTVGDPPYPVKVLNPDLKAAHERIEQETLRLQEANWMLPLHEELGHYEHKAFKLAEFIEMWEWGLHEYMLGNKMALPVVDRCAVAAREIMTYLTSAQSNAIWLFSSDVAKRADEYMNIRLEAGNE